MSGVVAIETILPLRNLFCAWSTDTDAVFHSPIRYYMRELPMLLINIHTVANNAPFSVHLSKQGIGRFMLLITKFLLFLYSFDRIDCKK